MTTKPPPRIYYCGMVNTEAYSAFVGSQLLVGAASNKMTTVVSAMRDAGAKAYLFSMPVLGRDSSKKYVLSKMIRDRSGPQIFTSVIANPYLRKIHAFFCFGAFCGLKVRKTDRVILYNHAVEYLLGVFILTIRGNSPILDIEDSVRSDDSGWNRWVGLPIYRLLNRWSLDRKLIVSDSLAKSLGLIHYCVVYGATKNTPPICEERQVRYSGIGDRDNPFMIHYGGSLSTDTGVDLFCSAVNVLLVSLRKEDSRIHFIVTGFGSADKLKLLRTQCENSAIEISYFPDLNPQDYQQKFRRCHAALSLKLPGSEMAMTTFPSKVVDITSNGLLLISTDVSDIAKMFDESSAIVLRESTSNALASAVIGVIGDPVKAEDIARRGQARAYEIFESKSVGTRVVDFVLNGNVAR